MPYRAAATPIGNSKGLRFDAALYREHPEFATGDFEADVIAPGRLLVRTPTRPEPDAESDPVFDAFLAFLEHHMASQPGLITPFTAHDVAGVDEHLDGVTADHDEDLGDDFMMP